MDITEIDFYLIEHFALSYCSAETVFDVEPVNASSDKQKEIRKWITKTYFAEELYTPETEKYIGKNASDSDFINFLKKCSDHVQQIENEKKQAFDDVCQELSPRAKDMIRKLMESDILCYKIKKVGSDVQIKIHFGSGYTTILVFENASFDYDEIVEDICFTDSTIIKRNDKYVFTAEFENAEEYTPFSITFTDARIDVLITNACEATFVNTPWMHLFSIASTILSKCNLYPETLNDTEKELMPLVAEISGLLPYNVVPEELKSDGFPILKSYLEEPGYSKPLKLLEKHEKDTTGKYKFALKLLKELHEKKYEPLWRKIYNLISESQKDYPSSAEEFCSEKSLSEIRGKIQAYLESKGYFGTYPDFIKHDSIRSYRLAEAYNMSYFVGAEKNVIYHIHCSEEFSDDQLSIDFLCGTQLLKKNEEPGDIYSCMFNSNGRCFFNKVLYGCDCTDDGEIATEKLEQFVHIAVKKAELQKLTKEERKLLGQLKYSFVSIFSSAFLLMGGLFATLMTLGLMLIALLITAILIPEEIPSMFAEMPWFLLFSLSWILFGGAMGIITALTERK